jgi:hypothetical protein
MAATLARRRPALDSDHYSAVPLVLGGAVLLCSMPYWGTCEWQYGAAVLLCTLPLFQPVLLHDGLNGGHVFWQVHAVRAVVNHNDLAGGGGG